MDATERILNQLRKLPDASKVEVLDFVDFFVIKARSMDEERTWSDLSIEAALRGMEDEPLQGYTDEDLLERWQ
ncbi:MAG: hypothetical protein PVF51_07165 [Nitrospirota bacterium]|jgi:hypothetical protein